ncbi:hypothetical protein [Pleionea litopenaei]|uniref:Uncharacterized protein n=1 Tax=Pleionea litopenaei TaxID=3070815 RepID=A0AA51X7P0_9GAMM|nr:hypothetical protein [Pleionea sp. HL-JVS1]WMS88418.1 hypothetical protein Q9312_05755 [Pleionea sp. HL-JVS1]
MNEVDIYNNVEQWDNGELGRSEEHVRVSNTDPKEIDAALELQMISIRMQKTLLDDLKLIAKMNDIGYQPLMKQVLRRFATCELKKMAREFAALEQGDETEAYDANDEQQAMCG